MRVLFSKIFIRNVQLPESGTNLKAINIKLPAPAIAANTKPRSVGIVLDAKKNVKEVISMINKLIE